MVTEDISELISKSLHYTTVVEQETDKASPACKIHHKLITTLNRRDLGCDI
jgi:hypothetical protein